MNVTYQIYSVVSGKYLSVSVSIGIVYLLVLWEEALKTNKI